jgi:uncharacterized membrane protein
VASVVRPPHGCTLGDLEMYSKITVAGHPVHPMLVAFPVAFYTGTLAGFAIYTAAGGAFWLKLAIALNVVGLGMAFVAALPGMADLGFGVPRDSGARTVGIGHAALNFAALGLFAATLAFYVPDWSSPAGTSPVLGLALTSAGVLATIAAGALGWMLVQTYHVGIKLTPTQAGDEIVVQQVRPHLRLTRPHRHAA